MKQIPSMDAWLKEAKQDKNAARVGMYLTHNGIVRDSNKASVRYGEEEKKVRGMYFSYDEDKVNQVITETLEREGSYYVRAWLNEGELEAGDDIMYVLIGGDIRPHIVDALKYLVGRIKNECVVETEIYED